MECVERGLCLGTEIEGGKKAWRGALGDSGTVQRDPNSSWHMWNSAGVCFGHCGINITSLEVSEHLGGEIPAHDPQEHVAKAAPRLTAGKHFQVLHLNQ